MLIGKPSAKPMKLGNRYSDLQQWRSLAKYKSPKIGYLPVPHIKAARKKIGWQTCAFQWAHEREDTLLHRSASR